MEHFFDMLIAIGCGCVLPALIVWFIIRARMNETNQRTQVVLSAIEKNPDLDVEELISKMAPKRDLLKEKLLRKLLWGLLFALAGIGFIVFAACLGYAGGVCSDEIFFSAFIGIIMLAIGIAFLVNYIVGKKMLANEMEAEGQKLAAQAQSK